MKLCHSKLQIKKTVLWIRISFNADPDPIFLLNKHPDPGSQTNEDPDADPGQTLKSLEGEFLHEKYTLCR
jgi:hypothetical protein